MAAARRTMTTDLNFDFPVLTRDLYIDFDKDKLYVKIPKEIAGFSGNFRKCDETMVSDTPELVLKSPETVPSNGMFQIVRLASFIHSNPKLRLVTLGYPTKIYPSPRQCTISSNLSLYGFPERLAEFITSSFSVTDVFDMILVVETLQAPEIRTILLYLVAAYINTIPDNVYIACFVPTPETGEAPTIELPLKETKAILKAHPWIADKKDASFIQDDTFTEETRKHLFENRSGGPNEDLPLVEGLQRISLDTYKQICKFI